MFKFACVLFAIFACAAAKPGLIGAHLAYTAPAAAVISAPAPVVTATSSQVIARNYNGVVSAPVFAPVAAPVIAKAVAVPPVALSTPLAAPLGYSAALTYAAAPVVW